MTHTHTRVSYTGSSRSLISQSNMASSSRGYPIRALMDRDLHDGSAVYPSVLSRIGGSLSFLPVSRSINPPSPSPKRKRGRYRRQSRHFIALDASLVREIKRGGKKREKRKKKSSLFEQVLTTIASSLADGS